MRRYVALLSMIFCLVLSSCAKETENIVPDTVPEVIQNEQSATGITKTEVAKTETPSTENADITTQIKEMEENIMQIKITSAEYEIIYQLNDSRAAQELYSQLPLTTKVEPFSNNEMTFYPPDKLNTANTPLSGGEAGSLSYYAPWGDVVMFYAPCTPNNSLYELGDVVSGKENIEKLAGEITVSVYE